MQNRTWARLRHKQIVLPEVEPKKGQSHQEQTECRYLAGSTGANRIHQSVTSFNTKTAAVFFCDLSWLPFELTNDDVSKTKYPMTLVFALAVFTNDSQWQGFLAINGATAFIGGSVAFSPHQQRSGTTFFATDDQRDDGRERLFFQVSDQAIVVKPSVKIQTFNTQIQLPTPSQQPFDHILCLFILSHQNNSQGIASVLFNDIQRGENIEMSGAAFGTPSTHEGVIFCLLTMIGQ